MGIKIVRRLAMAIGGGGLLGVRTAEYLFNIGFALEGVWNSRFYFYCLSLSGTTCRTHGEGKYAGAASLLELTSSE